MEEKMLVSLSDSPPAKKLEPPKDSTILEWGHLEVASAAWIT